MNQNGFSLIELLLSTTIIMIVTGLSIPLYHSFVQRNDLDLTAQTVTSAIRRAQTYARAPKNDTSWGIAMQADRVTIFQGTSYASRNSNFDETTELPDSITGSGLSEVVFGELSGNPGATGTYTLSSNSNTTKAITINAKGSVDY